MDRKKQNFSTRMWLETRKMEDHFGNVDERLTLIRLPEKQVVKMRTALN
jgi:hypothetical protein